MTNYVLVHGAWGDAATFTPVRLALEGEGHRVIAPALTGLGSRASESRPGITLSTHVSDVIEAINAGGFDRFVLAGHSYGGMIISAVAERLAASISAIVYIDAFLPRDGEMLWDIATDWERDHYINGQREHVGLIKPFVHAPYGKVLHPLLTLLEPAYPDAALQEIARKTYIFATEGAPGTFRKFRDRAMGEPSWTVREIPCGHMVQIEAPATLIEILLENSDAL